MQSGKGFFFWSRVVADGSYEIKKVRGGEYSIWVLNDDYRHWGLWLKYPEEFPDDVDFTVGKSSERTDWN